jgi:hypothetical protein
MADVRSPQAWVSHFPSTYAVTSGPAALASIELKLRLDHQRY